VAFAGVQLERDTVECTYRTTPCQLLGCKTCFMPFSLRRFVASVLVTPLPDVVLGVEGDEACRGYWCGYATCWQIADNLLLDYRISWAAVGHS